MSSQQNPHESAETAEPTTETPPVDRASSVGLPMVLSICVALALLLIGVGIGLYFRSNLSRIDLSKPKYADIRPDLLPGSSETLVEEYDTSSPVTYQAIGETLDEVRRRRAELGSLGNFSSPALSDASLGVGGGRGR